MGGLIIVAIGLVLIFGISIGNVRIGKRTDSFKAEQRYDLEQSEFAQNYLDEDLIVCVNLWATWCGPCIKEMPLLNDIKEEYENKAEFISSSLDRDSTALVNFIDSGKFDFKDITLENIAYRDAITNFLAQRPLDFQNKNWSIPITYLIKNGEVKSTLNGKLSDGELESEIDKRIQKK